MPILNSNYFLYPQVNRLESVCELDNIQDRIRFLSLPKIKIFDHYEIETFYFSKDNATIQIYIFSNYDQTKNYFLISYYLRHNNVLKSHRDGNKPSEIASYSKYKTYQYYKLDAIHRTNGSSLLLRERGNKTYSIIGTTIIKQKYLSIVL